MRLVQFRARGQGRRVGLVEGSTVYDLTSLVPEWTHVYHLFRQARRRDMLMDDLVAEQPYRDEANALAYHKLLAQRTGQGDAWLLPPLDHPDTAHCIIGGTGLTHLGSTAQRDAMHQNTSAPKTDSQKMFEMGVVGGKPEPGTRGTPPECFYKGSGVILRGHNDYLDIPGFTEDGGEEPEIVGCYVIDDDGQPYRLGFALANEWSDHAVERVNYLWLAPSKLRTCAVGPELITDQPFQDLQGWCRITRGDASIYDSGELLTGEENMCHSLANLEDHHFKNVQFRVPGDVHIYFMGTVKFSFGQRGALQDMDRIEIHFSTMGASLVNYVRRLPGDKGPMVVKKG